MPADPVSELVPDLVTTAVRAPSSHNTQPWRFTVDGDLLGLRADRTRALPVNDPEDRELTISCGAALFTLRVAAAARDLTAEVSVLPDRTDPDLLATVRLGPGPADSGLAGLLGAVARRRTHRSAFTGEPLPADLLDRLAAAAAAEGARLELVAPTARDRVAELVERGDRAQFADRRWRRELASWMRPRSSGDGLAVPPPSIATRLVVTTFDLGARIGRADARLVRDAPALAVLCTGDDGPAEWVRAGQALQRVLLVAAAQDVFAGFANQPCQIGGAQRRALAAEVGGTPQAVLRLGRPGAPDREPAPSARRPLDDVLVAG